MTDLIFYYVDSFKILWKFKCDLVKYENILIIVENYNKNKIKIDLMGVYL